MNDKFYVFAVNKVSRFDRLVGVYGSRAEAERIAFAYNSEPLYAAFRYDVRESLNG